MSLDSPMAKICVSQNQALEERLSNMHEQMAGVTSRLDQTERALDLERAVNTLLMATSIGKAKGHKLIA